MTKPLLPPGCYDVLPPFARQERLVLLRLLSVFDAYGYEEVAPPLMEYTETLLAGRGQELSPQVFRIMDPDAHKVMGIRADITLQIARIAATRLAAEPLPLRLSYAGRVLRSRSGKEFGGRELRQAGIELIGIASPQADAEVIIVAARALLALGIRNFTIDLNIPGLVGQLLAEEAPSPEALEQIQSAVAHKDASLLTEFSLRHSKTLAALIGAAGPAETVLPQLRALALPGGCREQVDALEAVAKAVRGALGDAVAVTLDPTEARGFEYHNGITFSFFAGGVAHELGRGGRYRIENHATTLEATGFTLYINLLRHVLPQAEEPPRVFVADADGKGVEALQAKGYKTLLPLPEYDATPDEARRLGCTHYYAKGKLEAL